MPPISLSDLALHGTAWVTQNGLNRRARAERLVGPVRAPHLQPITPADRMANHKWTSHSLCL